MIKTDETFKSYLLFNDQTLKELKWAIEDELNNRLEALQNQHINMLKDVVRANTLKLTSYNLDYLAFVLDAPLPQEFNVQNRYMDNKLRTANWSFDYTDLAHDGTILEGVFIVPLDSFDAWYDTFKPNYTVSATAREQLANELVIVKARTTTIERFL